MSRFLAIHLLTLPLAFATGAATYAQTAPQQQATPAVTGAPPPASLADRQKAVRDRLARLEERMLKLIPLIGESEPEKAERLRDALNRAGERQLGRRLESLAKLLQQAKFSDANAGQTEILKDLEGILTLLTDTTNDLDRRRQERERLEALRRTIASLQQQQLDQLYRTSSAENNVDLAEKLREQAELLERTAAEQRELAERDNPREVAEAERALADRVRGVSDTLEHAQKSRQTPDAAQPLGQAAQDATRAADAMHRAAESFDRAYSDATPQSMNEGHAAQQEADEELRRAIRRLREEAQRLMESQNVRAIERQQREVTRQTGDLERQLAPPEPNAPESPGRQPVGQAREQMQRAGDRLGEQDLDEAAEHQQEALDKLQRAMDELSDALRQVRQQEMEETLTALEVRFKSMLIREEPIRESVAALHARSALTREDELSVDPLAQTQAEIAADCDAVRRILVDEGTTVILPELVADLSTDMNVIQKRLSEHDVSDATLQTLDAVLAALREILGAIEQKREQMAQDDDSQENNPQDGSQALLPGSAELKLLRSTQVRINDRTASIAESADPAAATQFEELSARQLRLMELTRRMHERH